MRDLVDCCPCPPDPPKEGVRYTTVCCGAYHIGDGPITDDCCEHCRILRHAKESLEALELISDWAYVTGFHELGYDPVVDLSKALGFS